MAKTRREFLKTTGRALSMAALAGSVSHFGKIAAFAQQAENTPNDFADYKALVCVFLDGGNDSNNMIVPIHDDASISNYAAYRGVRAALGLALPRSAVDGAGPYLIPISVPRIGGLMYGMHPALSPEVADATQAPGLLGLWNTGKMAVVNNIGNLVGPLTRVTYQNNTGVRPYQLFSHSDQSDQQMNARADRLEFTGWGGRIADKLTPQDLDAAIPMVTSIRGNVVFTSGVTSKPLTIGTGNLNNQLVINGFNATPESVARRNALNSLRTIDLTNNVVKAVSDATNQAVALNQTFATNPVFTTVFPSSSLGQQLLQVARIISLRTTLGANRQIFYVRFGGFDTHGGQLASHDRDYREMGQAMRAFYNATVEMGIQNQVTQFTLSDFGRTLEPSVASDGTIGTDHAWGTHSIIVGGSVNGGAATGNFYGMNTSNGTPFPTLALNGPDDTDNRGRWIPTTSVDQYAAVLATWFGVDAASLTGPTGVLPNLGNFTWPTPLLSFI
jgi:uncharacterized protein (DUF1501 family)